MNAQDLRRFSAAVLAVYECRAPDDLGRALTLALQKICDNDSQVVQTIGGDGLQICESSRAIDPGLLEVQNQHLGEHPLFWIIGHAAAGKGPVAGRWSDHTTLREFRQKALYHDFFRPLDVQYQSAATVRVNEEVTLGLSLHRATSDFRPEEVQLFELLLPHVREVTLRLIGQAEVAAALQLRDLTIGSEAVLIVDEQGALHFATERARQLLGDYFAVTGPDGMPPEIGAWLRRKPAPGAKLVREGRGRRLVFTCGSPSPSQGGGVESLFPNYRRARSLRRVVLTEFNEESAQTALQARGLTRRQAEVLHWMAQGKRNGEIALILGISERTVEKHAESIFATLGVETRLSAVACYQEVFSRVEARR